VLVVINFMPLQRHTYRYCDPYPGYYRELSNSDASEYGGSNLGNAGGAWAQPTPWQGQPHSLALTLPPLAVLVLKPSCPGEATTSSGLPIAGTGTENSMSGTEGKVV